MTERFMDATEYYRRFMSPAISEELAHIEQGHEQVGRLTPWPQHKRYRAMRTQPVVLACGCRQVIELPATRGESRKIVTLFKRLSCAQHGGNDLKTPLTESDVNFLLAEWQRKHLHDLARYDQRREHDRHDH